MMANSSDESDIDNPTPLRTPPKKKQKMQQKHRVQHFRSEWCSDHLLKSWLMSDPTDKSKAKCKWCNLSLKAEYHVLTRHAESSRHKGKMSAKPVNTLDKFMQVKGKKDSLETQVDVAEIKLAAFIAEHKLSFRVADHLTALMRETFKDHPVAQNLKMKRTKVTKVITNVIGQAHKEDLARRLKDVKFSVLTDESTDISTVKSACVVVRLYNGASKKVESLFWELDKVYSPQTASEGATAENLYASLKATFDRHNIRLQNVIGFGSDGANVMQGETNSLASRFRTDCPGIFVLKCVCHSAHIAASEACKRLPRACEDLARNVFTHFSRSAKRQTSFLNFQKFAEVEPHKILHPAQTRFSLVAVVDRMIEQWDALTLYFNDQWFAERLLSSEQIHKALNDPVVKLYYQFLSFILPKFAEFNAFFQSKEVVIMELHPKLRKLYKDILLCFMRREYILRMDLSKINPSNKQEWLPDAQLYLGTRVALDIRKVQGQDLQDFFVRCRGFYEVAALEMRSKYNFDDPVLSKLSFLTPENAQSSEFRVLQASLLELMVLMPRVVGGNDHQLMQKIDDQWRSLPYSGLLPDMTTVPSCSSAASTVPKVRAADEFWSSILEWQSEAGIPEYKELAQFALDVLSLPHSNADCERIFSQVNLMKTKIRNRLNVETVSQTLLASQCVKEPAGQGICVNFQPTKEMLALMTSKNLYGGKSNDEEEELDVFEELF